MPHMARSNAIFLAAGTLFVCSVFLGAQAPAAPQQTAPAPQGAVPAGPPAGRGGAPGTESGWATFQTQ